MNLDIDEIFNPTEASLELSTPKPESKVQIWKRFFGFIKKHRKLFTISVFAIILIISTYSLIPVISIGQLRLANTGAEIKLSPGQSVNLKFANVSVRLNNFVNDNCPANLKCFGAGVNSVEYFITINGHKYATGSASTANNTEFIVQTTKSDYSTYAEFKVIKNKSLKN